MKLLFFILRLPFAIHKSGILLWQQQLMLMAMSIISCTLFRSGSYEQGLFTGILAVVICLYMLEEPAFIVKPLKRLLFSSRASKTATDSGVQIFTTGELLSKISGGDKADNRAVYIGRGYQFDSEDSERFYASIGSADNRGGAVSIQNYRQNLQLYIPYGFLNTHTMIFGTTGTGKTSLMSLMVTQAVKNGDAVIVLDPKGDGELRSCIETACRETVTSGGTEGGSLYKHSRERDFCVLSREEPDSSIHCNILFGCGSSAEVADRLASLMNAQGSARNFQNYASLAIRAAAAILRLQQKSITIASLSLNFGDVEKAQNTLYSYLKKLADSVNNADASKYRDRLWGATADDKEPKKGGRVSLDRLMDFYSWLADKKLITSDPDVELLYKVSRYDKGYFDKVSNGIMPIFSSLDSKEMRAVISSEKQDLSIDDVLTSRKVLYVPLSTMNNSATGQNLGKLILKSLASLAGRINRTGNSYGRLSIFVDESSEVFCESLIQLLNKSRSANFALTVATQTYADMKARCENTAQADQIIGNCNNLICLRLADESSVEAVLKMVPDTKVSRRSASSTQGVITRGVSEEKCKLIPGQIFSQLPNLEYVAKLADGRFLKGRIPLIRN